MARHRNVRNLNYDEEYDFDDVYGRSVEEELCISPNTAAEFLYDRGSKSTNISAYFSQEENIPEEVPDLTPKSEYEGQHSWLNDIDQARLNSCLDEIRSIIGDSIPEREMVHVILQNDFDINKSLDVLLVNNTSKEPPKPQRQRKDRRRNADDFSSSEDESDEFSIKDDSEDEEELNLISSENDVNKNSPVDYLIRAVSPQNDPNSKDNTQNENDSSKSSLSTDDEFADMFNLSKFLPKPVSSATSISGSSQKKSIPDKCWNRTRTPSKDQIKIKQKQLKSNDLPCEPDFKHSGHLPNRLNDEPQKKNSHNSNFLDSTSEDVNFKSPNFPQNRALDPLKKHSNTLIESSNKNNAKITKPESLPSPLTKSTVPPPPLFSLHGMIATSIPSLNDLARKHMSTVNTDNLFSKNKSFLVNKTHVPQESPKNSDINLSCKINEHFEPISENLKIENGNLCVTSSHNENNLHKYSYLNNSPSSNCKSVLKKKDSQVTRIYDSEVTDNEQTSLEMAKPLLKSRDSLESSSQEESDESSGNDNESDDGSLFDLNRALKQQTSIMHKRSNNINEHNSITALKAIEGSIQHSPVSSYLSEDSGFSSSSYTFHSNDPLLLKDQSPLGAVLCMQLKPYKTKIVVPTDPYLSPYGSGSIKPYDFTDPSPDDLVMVHKKYNHKWKFS